MQFRTTYHGDLHVGPVRSLKLLKPTDTILLFELVGIILGSDIFDTPGSPK